MRMCRRMCLGALPLKTVSLTNMLTNGSFISTSGWTSNGASFSVASNEASFLANNQYDILYQNKPIVTGKKYYIATWIKSTSPAIAMQLTDYISHGLALYCLGSGEYEFLSGVDTAENTTDAYFQAILDVRSSGWNTVHAKYATMIDLTAAFGAGNELTKAQMDTLMSQFPNKWLNGTQTARYLP